MAIYMVECQNCEARCSYTYYEEADSLQEAVDKVRNYKSDDEEIVQVGKVMKGWK